MNGWLEVTFGHSLHISHALRRVEGRRIEAGHWRVPAANGTQLARHIGAFGLRWEGAAAAIQDQERLEAERWRAENSMALALKTGHQQPTWQPPIELLPHQQLGAAFLAARSGALLCDEQGLGKTVTCLVAFWLVRQSETALRLLVICPNSLKHVWEKEVDQFFPGWTVTVASGARRQRLRAYQASADIYVTNYEAVRSDRAELRWLMRTVPSVLVCDEAHALKNAATQTTRALQFIRPAAARAWLLTGTPVPNKVDDIYTQVSLADGGRALGSPAAFSARYRDAADDPAVLTDLHETLEPIVLRRTKDEVLDLPERIFEQRHVELRGAQRRMYEDMRDGIRRSVEAMSEEEFSTNQPTVLVRLLRLAQIASNPRLVDPTFAGLPAKVAEIDDLLAQLIDGNGRKVVLWSYYVQTIEELLDRYQRYQPVAIYGGIEVNGRAQAVQRFQEDDEVQLFIGNPQAAGAGITLTAATYAIYETLSWRYDLYAQSLDRIHRIGQHQSVTYFELLAAGSIDVQMRKRLGEKKAFASELLGDAQPMPELTRDEVVDILRPRESSY